MIGNQWLILTTMITNSSQTTPNLTTSSWWLTIKSGEFIDYGSLITSYDPIMSLAVVSSLSSQERGARPPAFWELSYRIERNCLRFATQRRNAALQAKSAKAKDSKAPEVRGVLSWGSKDHLFEEDIFSAAWSTCVNTSDMNWYDISIWPLDHLNAV